MSHDTHHENSKENKTIISFKSAFWLVVIIVGLFVAALNFIKAESGPGEEEKKVEGKEKVEMTTTAPPSAEGQNKNPETVPPVKPVAQEPDTAGKNGK